MFELGNSLRDARVRQGLDHAEVEQATKIRAKYIRAIEDEQFGILPAQTYVKGFLRTYADFLGLDGNLYVDEYNNRFAQHDEPLLVPERFARSGSRFGGRGLLRPIVVLGVIAAIVVAVAAWRLSGSEGSSSPATVTERRPAPTLSRRVAPGESSSARAVSLESSAAPGRVMTAVRSAFGGPPDARR